MSRCLINTGNCPVSPGTQEFELAFLITHAMRGGMEVHIATG